MSAILSFSTVSLSIHQRFLLKDISFQLDKGEFVYLVGRTGVGKSSLLKLIYADLPVDAGIVSVAGYQVSKLSRTEIPFLRRKLGIVFQDYQLLPDRSIYQNLQFALKATGWKKAAEIKRRISEVLLQVGLTGKANSFPHQLSGGEKQRAAIARALLNEPHLLIADEPTGNLDPETSQYIMELLMKIHHAGTAILMATHEYHLIKQFPSRVLELADATITNHATAEMFLTQYGAAFH
ncbi:MAG: ATP-binding cassette domain-containing protein [Bacteroidota bacterium]